MAAYIIAFINGKGGVGKSTCALNLADMAAHHGEKVLLLDADPQESLIAWKEAREGNGLPPFPFEIERLEDKGANLEAFIKSRARKYDMVIIDTEGHTNTRTPQIAALADFVLVPCSPTSLLDKRASEKTFSIFSMRKTGRAAFILNKCRADSWTQGTRELIEGEGFEVMTPTLSNRVNFEYSAIMGQSAREYDNDNQAARDIAALYKDLKRRLSE